MTPAWLRAFTGGIEEKAMVDLTPETKVGELLEAHPELLPIFLEAGFAPLADPAMRRTVARKVTIASACEVHGLDLEAFLKRLEGALLQGHGGG